MKVCAIFGSARKGNSEMLAEIVLHNITTTKIYLRDKHIQPVTDAGNLLSPDDDFEAVISTMLDHDILLFVTPLYWYSMSGIMKNFMDRWHQVLKDEKIYFRDRMSHKRAFLIVVGSGAKMRGLPLVQQFQYIFDYFSTTFSGYILGDAYHPNEIMFDVQAVRMAEMMNHDLCELINQ